MAVELVEAAGRVLAFLDAYTMEPLVIARMVGDGPVTELPALRSKDLRALAASVCGAEAGED